MTEIQHGEPRGWVAGCRESCCRAAILAYNRQRNSDVAIHGEAGRRRIDATGTQRRVQALMLMGWTAGEIAALCGWKHAQSVTGLLDRSQVLRTTAQRIDEAHEELWRRWRRGELVLTGLRERGIEQARRKGWVPSAAWDDIDNIAERPKGIVFS